MRFAALIPLLTALLLAPLAASAAPGDALTIPAAVQIPVSYTHLDVYKRQENHNADPKPFIWTKSAGQILEKVARAKQALESQH